MCNHEGKNIFMRRVDKLMGNIRTVSGENSVLKIQSQDDSITARKQLDCSAPKLEDSYDFHSDDGEILSTLKISKAKLSGNRTSMEWEYSTKICNRMKGKIILSLPDCKITSGPHTMTLKACGSKTETFETRVAKLMGNIRTVSRDRSVLKIQSQDDSITFRRQLKTNIFYDN